MWKPLILYLFAINAANAQHSRWLLAGEATEADVASLPRITASEALPFILFASWESEKLQTIFGLMIAEIRNGRLASGTSFFTVPVAPQIFFCQHSDITQKCLIQERFGVSEILQCSVEPIPILQQYPGESSCGADNTGNLLAFHYKICASQPLYRYEPTIFHIYSFCYDATAEKNIFASHSILIPSLLTENLLKQEREAIFTMNEDSYGLIDKDYYVKLQAQNQEYLNYSLQTLVPSEDMPLATLRKATHYYANYALQRVELIHTWNQIRLHIRNQAIRLMAAEEKKMESYAAYWSGQKRVQGGICKKLHRLGILSIRLTYEFPQDNFYFTEGNSESLSSISDNGASTCRKSFLNVSILILSSYLISSIQF